MEYPRKIEDYELLEKLGEGTYGIVSLAKIRNTDIKVAIKQTKPDEEDSIKNYEMELFTYKTLEHPNILKLYTAFREKDICYLIFEIMDADANHQSFSEEDIEDCAKSIFKAINYIHSYGLVHLDIKPANILYKKLENGTTKWVLADMGFVCNPQSNTCKFGSMFLMPPESFVEPHLDFTFEDYKKADYWSLGITIGYLYQDWEGNIAIWALVIQRLIEITYGGMDIFLEEYNDVYTGLDEEADSIQIEYEEIKQDYFENNFANITQEYIDIALIRVFGEKGGKSSKIARHLINVDPKKRTIPKQYQPK